MLYNIEKEYELLVLLLSYSVDISRRIIIL